MKKRHLLTYALMASLMLTSCETLTPEQLRYRQAEYELAMGKLSKNPKAVQAALPHLHNAAALSHTDAAYQLGNIYSSGKGIAANWPEAVKWYRKAASAGILRAQQTLADVYHHGRPGVSYNYQDAIRWYRRAGDKGDTNAQAQAGFLLLDTATSDSDFKEAHKWLERAGRNGNARARSLAFDLGRDIARREERQRLKRERERLKKERQRLQRERDQADERADERMRLDSLREYDEKLERKRRERDREDERADERMRRESLREYDHEQRLRAIEERYKNTLESRDESEKREKKQQGDRPKRERKESAESI